MSKAALLELADRVEKASGPDRELDRDIAASLSLPWDYSADWRAFDEHGVRVDRPVAFPYTSSLDAAMTLFVILPDMIPSNPRLATALALRRRVEE